MRVADAMTHDVAIVSPDQSLRDAAEIMARIDAGMLPVTDGDRLIGTITDRDIAVRGVALGLGPDTPVEIVMSHEVKYCFDDEDIGHVANNMGEQQLRRLPVVNRAKRLVGILSLADIAKRDDEDAGEALAEITREGGLHNQSDGDARGMA